MIFAREEWAGRTFICTITGVKITIPMNVRAGDFFEFGRSFIDVGDGYYSRWGGSPKEVFEEPDEE